MEPQEPTPRRARPRGPRRLRRLPPLRTLAALAAAFALLAGLYYVPAHLILATPLGPRLMSPNPERFRMSWESAWSPWPGEVRVRGLELAGGTRRIGWSVTAERARGHLDLLRLAGREVLVRDLEAFGVRSANVRREEPAAEPAPRRRSRRRSPWRVRLEGVELAGPLAVSWPNGLRLAGTGEVRGRLDLAVGRSVEAEVASLEMPAAGLSYRQEGGDRLLARDVALRASFHLGPYGPREHPGLFALDFVTGKLAAAGAVPGPAPAEAEAEIAAEVAAEIEMERGAVRPGSRLALDGLRVGGQPVRLNAAVRAGPGGPRLAVAAELSGLEVGGGGGRPPAVAAESVRLRAATAELRPSRWSVAARELRQGGSRETETALGPLSGDLEATGVRLRFAGSRAAVDLSAPRLDGTLDLPALLRRDLRLAGLRAEGATLVLRAPAEPVPRRPREVPPWAVHLADARVHARYSAELGDFDLQGEGALAADLRLERGRLLPGSRLSVAPARVRAAFLESRATGTGRLAGRVREGAAGPELDLRIAFDRFELAERGRREAAPYVRGEGLRLVLSSRDVDLADTSWRLGADLVLPGADILDLSFYDAYLPPDAGLEILGGRGRLGFRFQFPDVAGPGRGEVTITADTFHARVQDLEVSGRLDLRAKLAGADLSRRTFRLDGTRVAFDRVAVLEVGPEADGVVEPEPGWWARLLFESGTMTWSRPLALSADVRAEMRDSGPLLSLFSRKRRFLGWFREVLDVEGVTARGTLRFEPGAVVLDPLIAEGGRLSLRSRLRFAQADRRGYLLVGYGPLSVGMELENGRRGYRFVRPTQWYEGLEAFP